MTKLPSHLVPAYRWTAAAGELQLLADLADAELNAYVADSSANAIEHGIFDVLGDDLFELSNWLRENP